MCLGLGLLLVGVAARRRRRRGVELRGVGGLKVDAVEVARILRTTCGG